MRPPARELMDPVQKRAPQVIVRLIYALHDAARPRRVLEIGVASAEVALDLVDDFRIFLPHHAILAQAYGVGEAACTGHVFLITRARRASPIAGDDIHRIRSVSRVSDASLAAL